MASDKRKFDNFEEFPGKINQDTDLYEFPTLYSTDKAGHTRIWSIYVRLIKKDSKVSHKKINWNIKAENQVPIKKLYLKENIPTGLISQVWTESGILNGGTTRQLPTYPAEKNKGRINYRDFFKSALIMARAKYSKKLDEGALPDDEFKSPHRELYPKYFPMLAKKYDDYKKKHNITYPLYVQPKLDGIRCLVYLKPIGNSKLTWENVVLYSRRKKDFPINSFTTKIRKILFDILEDYYDDEANNGKGESLYLDGELYNHYLHLQQINSGTRKEDVDADDDTLQSKLDDTSDAKTALQYHIYDTFYPSQKETFAERAKVLKELDEWLDEEDVDDIIQIVETKKLKDENELEKQYTKYISSDYEGMMIRFANGYYANSSTGTAGLRSKDLLKKKETFTDEFELIGFTQGSQGRGKGSILWICQTETGDQFKAFPKVSYEEKQRLYQECKKNFQDKYANRWLTIEYRGLTENNIPSHAVAIGFRDSE